LEEELKNAQALLDKGLRQASSVLALKRKKVSIAGRAGRLTADLGD